jgi:hypothetical protein
VDHMKLGEDGEGQRVELAMPSNTVISSPQVAQLPLPQQQQQQHNQPSRKHSDLPPLPSELTDGPPAPSTSAPSQAESEPAPLGGPVRRRHSRGRSVTSKAEMMARPNSAKANFNTPQQDGSKDNSSKERAMPPPNRPTSPIHVSLNSDTLLSCAVRPEPVQIRISQPFNLIHMRV